MACVLITGGTCGIGFAFAKVFARENYDIVLVSSHGERLEIAKRKLMDRFPVAVYVYEQDLARLGAAEALYRQVKADKIDIDILVNNAGFGLVGKTEEIDVGRDEEMMVLNTVSLVVLCKLFLRDMYAKGHGKILNVSSAGAFQPGPFTSTYFAGKSFVLSYSRAVRYEAKGRGVQICTLCPGTTKTEFFTKAGATPPRYGLTAEVVAEAGYRGLMKNKAVIVPGFIFRALRLLPSSVKMAAIGRMKIGQ